MLMRFMNEFLAIMPTKLPDILPKKHMDNPAIYDDYVQLTYHPIKKLSLEDVANQLEEQAHLVLLYHRVVSDGLRGWQCCCAFSNPSYHQMYKFNATANDDGVVDKVNIFIFEDIEKMLATLREELSKHHQAGGMQYELSEGKLIKMFL